MYIKDLPKFPKKTRTMVPGLLAYKEYAEEMNKLLPELKEIIKFYNANKPRKGDPILVVRDDSRKRGSNHLFTAIRNKYGRFEIMADTDKFGSLIIHTPDVRVRIDGYKTRKGISYPFMSRVGVSSNLMPSTESGRSRLRLEHFDDTRDGASLVAFGKRVENFRQWMEEATE